MRRTSSLLVFLAGLFLLFAFATRQAETKSIIPVVVEARTRPPVVPLTLELELVRELDWHGDSIRCLAFSPDGKYLLSVDDQHTMHLWKVSSGERILDFYHLSVHCAAFLPDGRHFVSYGLLGSRKVWSVKKTVPVENHRPRPGTAFATDRQSFLCGSDFLLQEALKAGDCRTRNWFATLRLREDRVPTFSLNVQRTALPRVRRQADGTNSFFPSNSVCLLDPSTDSPRRRFNGHDKFVVSTDVSPDGKFVMSASVDGTVKVWSIGTGSQSKRLDGPGEVFFVQFITDHRALLVGERTEKDWLGRQPCTQFLCIWDIKDERTTFCDFPKRNPHVTAFSVSPDGRLVASGDDGSIALWALKEKAR